VKRNRLISLIILGIAVAIAISFIASQISLNKPSPKNLSATASVPKPSLQYKVYNLPKSTVHTLLIPAKSPFQVSVALSTTVDRIETFAQKHQAIAVLNGGFFDPINTKTTSYIVQNGRVTADPNENERLLQNPKLASYLGKILNRSEWRQYLCGDMIRYAIALHNDPTPNGCKVQNSLGGGPRLLPNLEAEAEGFIELANGKIVRDALGMRQANARTAVGITDEGDLIWVMAAQTVSTGKLGLSLPDLAVFLQSLGAKEAINLDGGSSSAFYYQGKTFYGKVDGVKLIQRPVKSVLFLRAIDSRL
jgi:Phosphodiester glycosidase